MVEQQPQVIKETSNLIKPVQNEMIYPIFQSHLGVVGVERLLQHLAPLLQEEDLPPEALEAAAVPEEGLSERKVP